MESPDENRILKNKYFREYYEKKNNYCICDRCGASVKTFYLPRHQTKKKCIYICDLKTK